MTIDVEERIRRIAPVLDTHISALVDQAEPSRTPQHPRRPAHRTALVVGCAALVVVAVVGYVVLRRGDDRLPPADVPTSVAATATDPAWFTFLRPSVPDRFQYLAFTGPTASGAHFVAIDIAAGKTLEIDVTANDVVVTCDARLAVRRGTDMIADCSQPAAGAFDSVAVQAVADATSPTQLLDSVQSLTFAPVPTVEVTAMLIGSDLGGRTLDNSFMSSGDHRWNVVSNPALGADVSVRLVNEVWPRPAARTMGVGSVSGAGLYEDAVAFWMVDPSGLAVHVASSDPSPTALANLTVLANQVLDAATGSGDTLQTVDLPPVISVVHDDCIAGVYIIKEGDFPAGVAATFDTTLDELDAVNAATDGYDAFFVGLRINIPSANCVLPGG